MMLIQTFGLGHIGKDSNGLRYRRVDMNFKNFYRMLKIPHQTDMGERQ